MRADIMITKDNCTIAYRGSLIMDLPTDILEYVFTFFTLEEFHDIGWVFMQNYKNYKNYWKKYQLLNWKNGYILHDEYNIRCPVISSYNRRYNMALLKFIYRVYFNSSSPLKSEIGESVPICLNYTLSFANYMDITVTILCLIKYLPYKKCRFQKLLEYRKDLCKFMVPDIGSILSIGTIRFLSIQNILLLSKKEITHLDSKIYHIAGNISQDSPYSVTIPDFPWLGYDKYPNLLIPLLSGIEPWLECEFAYDYEYVSNPVADKFKIIIKHFHPFIDDELLKIIIERSLITNPSVRKIEIILSFIPDRYGLLALGDRTNVNELGVIASVQLINTNSLSTFYRTILLNLLKYYFNMWILNFDNFANGDQVMITTLLDRIKIIKNFTWNPNIYFDHALLIDNAILIMYIVDNIYIITDDHIKTLDNFNTSNDINEYIYSKYAKYPKLCLLQ
jgi:hypothetical protein